ncbi:MAG: bifunctional glutamate N-acetyltransferase/amino-acid acetyltransferase ArgJ [Lachnospiraceae bacterium]|nr:bifunctional glutamate N-acetyltransferase/amino-acid acetyltransferase ArgJ [Lachnospiraceae bacterium]
MKRIDGGVTAAKGFFAANAAAGIKYQGRDDMALVYSEVPCVAAGTFTTNVVKASPVVWDMNLLKKGNKIQAVVLNSGIANACTGTVGDEMNDIMATSMAEALNANVANADLTKEMVFTASTGVIGMQLPKEPLVKGCGMLSKALGDSREAANKAARAIMTTDTVPKEACVSFEIDGKTVYIGGMAKGSGMIHPNMATMLSVVTTDVAIAAPLLQKAVSEVVADTFNMISVDRDTSTNDSFMVLANGLCGNQEITEENDNYQLFKEALYEVSKTLAKNMAKDGEGAEKLFETVVMGAKTKEKAKILAKSVITSNLVKTAIYGSDANWGRILCALGYAGVDFDPENVDLYITDGKQKMLLFTKGMATDYSEEEATRILSAKEVTAICDMHEGNESATAWGCDLTHEYVTINGDYRS